MVFSNVINNILVSMNKQFYQKEQFYHVLSNLQIFWMDTFRSCRVM